jgi:hypothetical protein
MFQLVANILGLSGTRVLIRIAGKTPGMTKWNPSPQAVVLDSRNCTGSKHIIGLLSVIPFDQRLAIFYDDHNAAQIPIGVKCHMNRDIGRAWSDLLLQVPHNGRSGAIQRCWRGGITV